MMQHKLIGLITVVISLLITNIGAVSAQCSDAMCTTNVSAGGIAHMVHYRGQQQAEADIILEAIESSIRTYLTAFNITELNFAIDVTMQENEGSRENDDGTVDELAGDAHLGHMIYNNATLPTCMVNMYYTQDIELIKLTIAHEIAHCFQFNYVPNYAANRDHAWWVEGSAEFLALQVYPHLGQSRLLSGYNAFKQNHRISVHKQNYDALFFWQFLSQQHSLPVVMETIINVPPAGADYDAAVLSYLYARIPDGDNFMWEYATALTQNQVNYAPSFNELVLLSENATPPASVNFGTEPFSVSYLFMSTITVEEGQKLQITANSFAASDQRIGILQQGTVSEMVDGQTIDVCDGSGIQFIVSRTGVNAATTSTISFELVDDDEFDCNEPPECVIGLWNFTIFPVITTGVELTWFPEDTLVEITEGNDFKMIITNFESEVEQGGMHIVTDLTADIRGEISLQEIGENQYYSVIDPNQSVDVVINVYLDNALINTLTEGDFAEFGIPVPEIITCNEDGSMSFETTVQGMSLVWLLERDE